MRVAAREAPHRRVPWTVLLAVLLVPIVVGLAQYGTKAVYAVGVLIAVIGLGYGLRDILRRDLVDRLTTYAARRRAAASHARRSAEQPVGDQLATGRPGRAATATGTDSGRRRAHPKRWTELVALVAVVGCGVLVAFLAAQLGTKGLVAAAGVVALSAFWMLVKDRTTGVLFLAVCSLSFLMFQSFGPRDLTQSAGAVSIYVSTFDVFLVLLYILWWRDGTFVSDLREAARQPLVWVPLIGVGLTLPSLLVAPSLQHAAAELVRCGWMFLLYFYVAVRLRTLRQVWAVLAGLAVIAAVELVTVVLQATTGGVLGLSFLGVPTSLGERTTDSETIGRPFGTMIHPTFLAAALGMIALIALALAVELTTTLYRLTALAVGASCLACMWIAQARASFVAAGVAAAGVAIVGLVRRRFGWRTVGVGAGAALVGVLAFWPRISAKLADNFRTGHFWEEVDSRLELNDLAVRIIGDHPVLGVGLNNFEVVIPRYEANPYIFPGHPVHNVYLLFLAEVGVVGFLGVAAVALVLYDVAITLARRPDEAGDGRLLSAVGLGVAGAMGFVFVEEMLGFALRIDIPQVLYWLLAGLAVACLRMSGRSWPHRTLAGRPPRRAEEEPPTRWRVLHPADAPTSRPRHAALNFHAHRRLLARRFAVGVAAALTLPMLVQSGPAMAPAVAAPLTAAPAPAPAPAPAGGPVSKLVFGGIDRATNSQAIFTANTDGSDVKRVTRNDGRSYSWPRWAFGNTKIVFTARKGPPGKPESIMLMDPDGSNPTVVRHFSYRVAHPIIDPTGRYVYYTAMAPWFPLVAQFRLDLRTGLSKNLSAVSQKNGAFDADPFLTRDGKRMVFVWNVPGRGTRIGEMRTDGRHRRSVTSGKYFDTDPGLSANGKLAAISSYRGPGRPSTRGAAANRVGTAGFVNPRRTVRSYNFHLVVKPVAGGKDRVLTQGKNCAARRTTNPCRPREMSAYITRFVPGDREASTAGALDRTRTCICAVSLDGKSERVILASAAIAIDWYDWPQLPGMSTTIPPVVVKPVNTSNLLLTVADTAKRTLIVIASPDLTEQTPIELPAGLQPTSARWAPDRRSILFTAKVKIPAERRPHPAAPAGQQRRAHTTLDAADPILANQHSPGARAVTRAMAQEQVFLRAPDGKVSQLTDPWIEDWRDGLAPADVRSNTQPALSPDGRYLTVTNTSYLTGESFLLRIDRHTGSVLNLTNGTSGAMAASDGEAAYRPGTQQLTFSWTEGALRGIYGMRAGDGLGVYAVTGGSTSTSQATWSPDGKTLVYVRETARGSAIVRAAATSAGKVGAGRVISKHERRAWGPVVSPSGAKIAYLGRVGKALTVFVADNRPGAVGVPIQPGLIQLVFSVDWGSPT